MVAALVVIYLIGFFVTWWLATRDLLIEKIKTRTDEFYRPLDDKYKLNSHDFWQCVGYGWWLGAFWPVVVPMLMLFYFLMWIEQIWQARTEREWSVVAKKYFKVNEKEK